jgi:DNA-binding NtrC family response regulator
MTRRPRRILIVDGNRDVRRFLAKFVTASGGEAVDVSSALEAFQTFQPSEFDMLLVDLDLGDGMDGITVAKELLALKPGLQVVIMSGNPKNAGRALAAGLGPLLTKPFDFSTLALTLGLE